MCQFLLLRITLIFVLLSLPISLSFGLSGWGDNTITLDVISDVAGGRIWTIIHPWFEYSNTSSDLEEFVRKKYPDNSESLDWDQFSDSQGIWGLFHEDTPPQIGLEPPSFAYNSQLPVLNVIIKYRLHGSNASIVVYNSYEERARIVYDCDQYFCEDGFLEAVIPLSDKPGAVGQFKFNLTLITKNEGEFILIDSITATGVGVTLPPLTTTEPDHPVTEEATTTSTKTTTETTPPPDFILEDQSGLVRGWTVTKSWFDYVDTSLDFDDIYEKYPMTPETDWTTFEESLGIWGLFHQNGPPEMDIGPPFFSYSSNIGYQSVGVKYFMGGTSFIDIYTGNELKGHIENYDSETTCGMKTTWITLEEKPELIGKYHFNISLKTTYDGDFILIDSISASKTLVPTQPTKPTTTPHTLPPRTTTTTTFVSTSTINSKPSSIPSEGTTTFVSTVTQTSTTITTTTKFSTSTAQTTTSSTVQSSSMKTTEEINEETTQWTTSSTDSTDHTSSSSWTESTSTEYNNIQSTTENSGNLLYPDFFCTFSVLTILLINLTKNLFYNEIIP